MAQPSTETNIIRKEITELLDALDAVSRINNRYVALGGETFFDPFLETNNVPNGDITTAEFVTAIASIQAMNNWLANNRPSLVKLRI